MRIHLGRDRLSRATGVTLPAGALLRHMMALGASGSGKTVLCKVVVEEAVRCGVPVICVDPQGDLCSLALADAGATGEGGAGAGADAGDESAQAAREYGERADVVVFTPASRKGIPLCADPLDSSLYALDGEDKLMAWSRAAAMIVALLGYDVDSDDGAGLRAVIETALAELDAAGRPAQRLEDITAYLTRPSGAGADADRSETAKYGRLVDARKLRAARQRLARLDVGARRMLFHDGLPIDIDMLLGRGPVAPAEAGKTRVSVIYLNTLHSQEDKDFFVAALVERLYAWMLRNPAGEPQALFYIDEIAPFMPPVRKPASKPGLQLLFKQARKYGVCCLMATQNPGDVDYKAMAQFGTWALGRLTTRQDLKKVEPIVKSMAPADSDAVMAELPARKAGEFALLSPDHFDGVRPLAARWLLSAHQTLDEDRIQALADERWRHRFQPADATRSDAARAAPDAATDDPPAPEDGTDSPDPDPGPDPGPDPAPPAEAEPEPASRARTRPRRGSGAQAKTSPAPTRDPRAEEHQRLARMLGARKSMTARELAERAGLSESRARSALKELVRTGHARSYKDGRAMRYFAVHTGARPDLGLGKRVAVVRPAVDEARVHELARGMQRTRLLGLIGDDEELAEARLLYRPVYQVTFEEQVERSGLMRLVGASPDLVVGTVYYHPSTLQLMMFTSRRGIEFTGEPGEYASRVEDIDGEALFDDMPPGDLDIDERAWQGRRSAAEVKETFRRQFQAAPRSVTSVFLPLWKLMFYQNDSGNYRVVVIDGLVGRSVDWP